MSDYRGHATMIDGSHVALTQDEARTLWEAAERAEAEAAEAMPDTSMALAALCRARQRLHRLGWQDGIYCPKDGREFAFIEYGSTGIFSGAYRGTWPDGWIDDGDGSTRPQGAMWKAIGELTEAERTKMEACRADHAEWLSSLGRRFGLQTHGEEG